MLKLKVKDAAVNCVTLDVDLEGNPGARIYRSRRASGPCEEVGLACERTYVDSADLEPGRTYFYRAVAWSSQWLHPDSEDLMGGRADRGESPTRTEREAGDADPQAAGVHGKHGRLSG